MGYGTAGIWNSDTKTYQPIAPQPDDARRFQNNSINTVFGNSIVGRYYEPLVQWNYAAPSAAGGGASFGGDSGGPYLTGTTGATYQATSVSVTPSFTNNVGSMNPTNPLPAGRAINIPLNFTDGESAVHVLGQSYTNDFSEAPGMTADGVPLVQTGNPLTGSYDWATYWANNAAIIPEPDSLALTALGGTSLLLVLKRQRQARRG